MDEYAKTLIKIYNVDKRLKRNFKYDTLTFLTKKEKLKFSLYEAELKLEQLKRVSKKILKYIFDVSFIRVRDCLFGSC